MGAESYFNNLTLNATAFPCVRGWGVRHQSLTQSGGFMKKYTVGQGWPGAYYNDHFATLEAAQAYMQQYIAKVLAQKTKKGTPCWVMVEKPAPHPNAWVCRYEFLHANTGKKHGVVQIIEL